MIRDPALSCPDRDHSETWVRFWMTSIYQSPKRSRSAPCLKEPFALARGDSRNYLSC